MSEEPVVDLDTLRRSRIERLEAELHELASRLTHLHWPSTDAEVTDCRKIRSNYLSRYYGWEATQTPVVLKGFAVGFRYAVDRRTYNGTLLSPVEVEPGDRFQIRYNPDHPDENNSLCSKNSPSTIYATVANVVLAALAVFFLLALFKNHLFKH